MNRRRQKLRDRLADAWLKGRPADAIRRIEQALRAGHQGAVLADQLTVLETEATDTAGHNRGSER